MMGRTRYTDRSIDREIERTLMREHAPQSLTDAELDLEREPVTRPPQALPCWAWVRYGSESIRVEGLLVAWTERACAVRWRTVDEVEHRAWLWAGAVTSRPTG